MLKGNKLCRMFGDFDRPYHSMDHKYAVFDTGYFSQGMYVFLKKINSSAMALKPMNLPYYMTVL